MGNCVKCKDTWDGNYSDRNKKCYECWEKEFDARNGIRK